MKKPANKKFKIAVAMSGGVDSSVAAKLLLDQGHEVAGIFLYFWKEEFNPPYPHLEGGRESDFENRCCSREALMDARRAAIKIGIPLYTLDFVKVFKRQVVDNFLSEYAHGRTPNPCVRCNKLVKLGRLIKEARKLGFDYLASGHYAGIKKKNLLYKLYKAKDKNKDQSYFLHTLNQAQLKHLLFPLSNLTKPEVRQLARKFKLPVAEKPDSQEICFIADKNHNNFLRRHLKLKSGPIVVLEGAASGRSQIESSLAATPQDSIASLALRSRMTKNKIVGRHLGLPLYTIGQRKGIAASGGPFYAAKMDHKKNILYVVGAGDEKKIYRQELVAENVNWTAGLPARFAEALAKRAGQAGLVPIALNCRAVTRYRQKAVDCRLYKISKRTFRVKFKQPLRAIAPGQSVVFYRGREVLGGGVIK